MASITTILGTDSVSSSRIVINENFTSINDELGSISEVLDTDTQNLILTGNISTGSLIVVNSGIESLNITSTSATVNVATVFEKNVTINQGIMYSIYEDAEELPSANNYVDATYLLEASAFASPVTLSEARNGQEITLIANGDQITINNSNILGATSPIVIADGGTLTLRYITSIAEFVIISAFKCTISSVAI